MMGPVSTWMGDCLRAGKPSWYEAFYPSWYSKTSIICLAE